MQYGLTSNIYKKRKQRYVSCIDLKNIYRMEICAVNCHAKEQIYLEISNLDNKKNSFMW